MDSPRIDLIRTTKDSRTALDGAACPLAQLVTIRRGTHNSDRWHLDHTVVALTAIKTTVTELATHVEASIVLITTPTSIMAVIIVTMLRQISHHPKMDRIIPNDLSVKWMALLAGRACGQR